MIDAVDLKILNILQRDARVSNVQIARAVGLAPSATLERIRKLEQRGLVRGYEARLDSAALGRGQIAFVFVRTNERAGATRAARRLALIPEVQEVHHIAGEDCFLVKMRVANMHELGELLRSRFGVIPSVISTRTTIVLETLKEVGGFPLPKAPESSAPRKAMRKQKNGRT